ncbi:YopX family protein [Streptococcus suis]|uniref:YopX family protein n=1 Tax=Streptococcus suis TaxID=1307 RepID=UPI0037565D49
MIPKFRAWDTEHGQWSEEFFVYSKGGLYTPNYGFNRKHLKNRTDVYPIVKQERLIPMQSTGLFDVNGKEIFVGDVVRVTCEHPIDFPDCKGVVRMLEGRYMVCDDKTERCSELFSEIFSNEIIGNIYENPELMEVLDEN